MIPSHQNVFLFIIATILLLSYCKKKENIIPNTQNMSRDEAARQAHYPTLKKALYQKGVDIAAVEVFIRAFKQEQKLEVWVKKKAEEQFIFLKSYSFCKSSGQLGPKRQEGDYQIPEGLYHINIFNPLSNFHLSLGINYPNESDKILGDTLQPGSDIYIHGGCMTIGCIPITNECIKELYTLTNIAHEQGQTQIPVHIFPFQMDGHNMQKYTSLYPPNTSFWNNLQIFHDYFEKNKKLPLFKITEEGIYKKV